MDCVAILRTVFYFLFLMIRRPPRSTLDRSSAASDVYKRQSTNRPSARDEILALKRALSARKYLVDRGVSPLKIMVNFASAADYVTENITPEGRYQNQRVEIELIYVPMF